MNNLKYSSLLATSTLFIALFVYILSMASIDSIYFVDFIFLFLEIITISAASFGIYSLLNYAVFRFNFFLLSSPVIMLGSASGALFSYINLNSLSEDGWKTVLQNIGITMFDIIYAQAITNLFSISLLIFGILLQKSGNVERLYINTIKTLDSHNWQIYFTVMMLSSVQLYLLLNNIVVYGGKPLENVGFANHPLESLMQSFSAILPFVCAYYLSRKNQKIINIRFLLFSFVILLQIYWFFLHGRRSIVFCFILALCGLNLKNSINIKSLISSLVPLLISMYVVFQIADLYNKMRTIFSFEKVQTMNIIDIASGLNATDIDYEKFRKFNLANRSAYNSLALAYFVNLFLTTNRKPLNGKSIVNMTLNATPSSFFVDKENAYIKENLYSREYAIQMSDISETIYLESFVDFGILGTLFIYPVLLFITLYPFYLLTIQINPVCGLFLGSILVYLGLSMIEVDTLSYLVALRSLSFYLIFYLIFRSFLWIKTPVFVNLKN